MDDLIIGLAMAFGIGLSISGIAAWHYSNTAKKQSVIDEIARLALTAAKLEKDVQRETLYERKDELITQLEEIQKKLIGLAESINQPISEPLPTKKNKTPSKTAEVYTLETD